MSEPLDLLAVGAHPDDVELFAGGTLKLLAGRGFRVGILNLTRGECGTRGSAETRAAESEKAREILGIDQVVTLDLGDGRLESSHENRQAVVEIFRELRPAVVMTHGEERRHPDHSAAHLLVRDSAFLANVGGYQANGERHKVADLIYFVGHTDSDLPRPDWIVDISAEHESKVQAIAAYGTQFFTPATETIEGPATELTRPSFWEAHVGLEKKWGHLVGGSYGEAFQFLGTPYAGHPFVKMLTGKAGS